MDPSSPPQTAVAMLAYHEGVLGAAVSLGLPASAETLTMRDLLLVVVNQGKRIAELERRLSEMTP